MFSPLMRSALIAAVGLAPIAGSASAQSDPQTTSNLPGIAVVGNSVRVSYADIDTRTPLGLENLKARVSRAVVEVCRFHDGKLLEPLPEVHCRFEARTGAWEQFARNEAIREYAYGGGSQEVIQPIEIVAITAPQR